jgi:hypothetical protein
VEGRDLALIENLPGVARKNHKTSQPGEWVPLERFKPDSLQHN